MVSYTRFPNRCSGLCGELWWKPHAGLFLIACRASMGGWTNSCQNARQSWGPLMARKSEVAITVVVTNKTACWDILYTIVGDVGWEGRGRGGFVSPIKGTTGGPRLLIYSPTHDN